VGENRRVAKLVIRDTNEDRTIEIGSLFTSPFEGTYGLALGTYDKDTKERKKIVALKPEGGEVIRIGEKGVFVNLYVYEELEPKPSRD
jgi:hypothetical protein